MAEDVFSSGYYDYVIEEESVSIVHYFGKEETVTVPSSIAALPVSRICKDAFTSVRATKTIILPDTIMVIETGAFKPEQTIVYSERIAGTVNAGTNTSSEQSGEGSIDPQETHPVPGANGDMSNAGNLSSPEGNEDGRVLAEYQGQPVVLSGGDENDTGLRQSGVDEREDDIDQDGQAQGTSEMAGLSNSKKAASSKPAEQKTSDEPLKETEKKSVTEDLSEKEDVSKEDVSEAVSEKEDVSEAISEKESASEAVSEKHTEETPETEPEPAISEAESKPKAEESKKGMPIIFWIAAIAAFLAVACFSYLGKKQRR